MLILGNFGKLPIGQILSDLNKFVLLNSHRVDLPRAMKQIPEKFQIAPVRTRKI